MDALPLDIDQNDDKKPSFGDSPSKILIIDDDSAILNTISEPIKSTFPYINLKLCTSPDEALELLEKLDFDFIITDWRMKGTISGLALINRLRNDAYYQHIPILVVSGYLQENDFNFLKEFNFTSSLLKPFRSQLLIRAVKDLFKEAKWFYTQQDYLREFLREIEVESNISRIKNRIDSFTEDCPRPIPTLLLCSQLLRKKRLFEKAMCFAVKASQLSPGSLVIDSELGKLYLNIGDLKKAQEHLEIAYKQSPNNLERLCDLGQIKLEEFDTDSATDLFKRALNIDPKDKSAQEGVLISEQLDHFFRHNNPSAIPETFAGLLNAIAIGMVRNGEVNNGIDLYTSALRYLHNNHDKAMVCFNLGLGYYRCSSYSQAKEWLNRSLNLNPDHEKSKEYLLKALNAISNSIAPIETDESDDIELSDEDLASVV